MLFKMIVDILRNLLLSFLFRLVFSLRIFVTSASSVRGNYFSFFVKIEIIERSILLYVRISKT